MQPPVWSVLIPTCEPDPAHLSKTIESARQSLDGLSAELILVDDASRNPSSIDAISRFQKEGIAVVWNEHRRGISGNLNRCIEISSGQLLHLLHQDDLVSPAFYQRMEEAFAREHDIGGAFCRTEFIDEEGRVVGSSQRVADQPTVLNLWVEHVIVNLAIQTVGMIVRRDVYEEVGGFRDDLAYALDWEMWGRIAARFPIWYDPERLARRRLHDASATSRLLGSLVPWTERKHCIQLNAARLPAPLRERAVRASRGYVVRLARGTMVRQLSAGDWRMAVHSLAGGMIVDPAAMLLLRWIWRPPARVPSRAIARTPSRDVTKRLLLITEFTPLEKHASDIGAVQRLDRFVKALCDAGELDALFLVRFEAGPAHEVRMRVKWPELGQIRFIQVQSTRSWQFSPYAWRNLWTGRVSFFSGWPDPTVGLPSVTRRVRKVIDELQPDLVLAHRLGALAAVGSSGTRGRHIVTDLDDLEHVRIRRSNEASGNNSLLGQIREAVAWRAEKMVLKSSTVAMLCSQNDAEIMRRLDPRASVAVVENSSMADGPLEPAGTPTALFVGAATYPPNDRAIRWLVESIWPKVIAALPRAKLTIAGFGSNRLGLESGCGIRFAGYVEDIGKLYRQHRIALCPIREGSGTRIKIIEAALYARACVSTPIGMEGLQFVPGREILVANTTDDFARACISLLGGDGKEGERIAQAAHARAKATYSPERADAEIHAILSRLLHRENDS